ncbi:phosphotriesterase [Streptosporangium fragile]|uniref:Phosphotriesterase n=1 Tax=Streptosporangium fragile TaxID=46186 RepID=A0ABN3W679_9ACTN
MSGPLPGADAVIRTVLGDVPPGRLGRTDYHEHLFQATPLLSGDELDDEERSAAEAGLLRASGIDAMIDATPCALGRDPAAVARISHRTGLRVVMTTGAHRLDHYGPDHWITRLSPDDLAALFTRDLLHGVPARDRPPGRAGETPAAGPDGEPVRAGVLKAGIGYWSIGAFERRVIEAVGEAHRRTGAPVMVHLEHGSASFEVLALLRENGVAAGRVALAHIDRNPDPGLHAELAAAGAYLGYDGVARHRGHPDSVLLDCLCEVAARGGASRLLLGGDVARRTRYVAYGGMPGLGYLGERFLPRLRERAGEALERAILVDNPARLLARRAVPNPARPTG